MLEKTKNEAMVKECGCFKLFKLHKRRRAWKNNYKLEAVKDFKRASKSSLGANANVSSKD